MEYGSLGKTGLTVSRLGFGAMRLPMKNGHVDRERAGRAIHRAFALGVTYVDCAVGYCAGESEITMGECLKGYRDRIVVSTKNPYHKESGVEWRRLLDQSLKRLDIPFIDCYHLHFLSYASYAGPMHRRGGPRSEMVRALKEGVIRHLGFSSHDTPRNIGRLIGTGDFETMTVQYNLLDRKNERVIATAAKRGMGVVIMGPVGGGRLAFPSERIAGLLKGARNTPEIALRFVLANPNVSVAISGMNTLRMVEENARTASRTEPLSKDERRRIIATLDRFQQLSRLSCTGCGYCMPCPHGVDIPGNFALHNYARVFGLHDLAARRYAGFGTRKDKEGKPTPAWAAACRECGACEPKCPQKIPIIRQLKAVRRALGKQPRRKVVKRSF